MTCEQFDAKLDAYLAGMLSESDATAFEMHAAECARCEARLETATRVTFSVQPVALPPEIRSRTLSAVRNARTRQRTTRWTAAAAAIAAAVVVTTFVSRDRSPANTNAPTVASSSAVTASPPKPDSTPTTATAAAPNSTSTVAPESTTRVPRAPIAKPKIVVAAAPDKPLAPVAAPPMPPPTNKSGRVAYDHSTTEFTALDTAARELEDAISKSPNDAQLRAFLETVKARRDELVRRIKAASS